MSQIFLFYSKASQTSIKTLNTLIQHNIPFMPVSLDTPEARKRATSHGKYFQIKYVPTLAIRVTEEGGDMTHRLYVGHEKILAWLTRVVSAFQQQPPNDVPSDTESKPVNFDSDESSEETAPVPTYTVQKEKSVVEMAREMESQREVFNKGWGAHDQEMTH